MPVKEAATKTTFAKVGDSVAKVATATSRGVQRGKLVKKGNSKGGMLEGATASHKANIQERMGATFTPKATLYAANAPEAAQTQRNTRIVPSALGNRDFYLRRQYGQGM
jgi:hypothetical protein